MLKTTTQKKTKKSFWEKIKKYIPFNFFYSSKMELLEKKTDIRKNIKKDIVKVDDVNKLLESINLYKNNPKFCIKILDTSSLLRSSFINMIQENFFDGFLYIPSFVLREAHTLSDSKNHLTRTKGKNILNNIINLEKQNKCFTNYSNLEKNKEKEVDYQLIKLSLYIKEKYNIDSKIVTADNNLDSLCSLNKIGVLNINKFRFILNQNLQQGDKIEVYLTEKGDKENQARGNTEDGTLVIVEKAGSYINKKVSASVKKIWITENTKIIFCNFCQLS